MKQGSALQASAKWIGLLASCATIALGITHMAAREPRLKWPKSGFLDDINYLSWREAMFSLRPLVFVDTWTPVVFGLWGVAAHFPKSGKMFGFVTTDFLNYALYNLVVALFANLAYNGGLGIIFSVFSLMASLLSFIIVYAENDSASLELEIKRR